MSLSAYKWAKEVRGIKGVEKHILIYIADRYNDAQGFAWPSQRTISRETGWSARTVGRAIRSLQELGLIEIRHQFYRYDDSPASNRYYLPELRPAPEQKIFEVQGGPGVYGDWDMDYFDD